MWIFYSFKRNSGCAVANPIITINFKIVIYYIIKYIDIVFLKIENKVKTRQRFVFICKSKKCSFKPNKYIISHIRKLWKAKLYFWSFIFFSENHHLVLYWNVHFGPSTSEKVMQLEHPQRLLIPRPYMLTDIRKKSCHWKYGTFVHK